MEIGLKCVRGKLKTKNETKLKKRELKEVFTIKMKDQYGVSRAGEHQAAVGPKIALCIPLADR